MKTTLLVGLLFLAYQSFSQSNKFIFGFEISPNFTNVVTKYPYTAFFGPSGFYPTFNFDFKSCYILSHRFAITGGAGYMITREFEEFEVAMVPEINRIVSHRFHAYVFVPVGIKYNLGSFFISPEIAVGWNTSNRIKSIYYYTDNSIIKENINDPDNLHIINSVTYPIFLTFGNEFQVKSSTITIGVKSYYGLNSIGDKFQYSGYHYYGFGVFGGVSF